MRQYVLRRLLLLVPTLLIITVFVFMVVRLFPGDVVTMLTVDAGLTPEQLATERARLGLDQPVYIQYVTWMASTLRGDLGRSLWSSRPVISEIQQRLPVTLELGMLSIFFSIIMGIPIGIIAAIRQDKPLDYLTRSVAIIGLAIPGWWMAVMLVLVLSTRLRWMPPLRYTGFFESPLENVGQFALPAFILGIYMAAALMRMTRTSLLEVLRQDYIRTAWAKGLRERVVLVRHALKNSLIPVMTIIGVQIAMVIGGSVWMENIFSLPGLGQYTYQVLLVRDYPAIQAVNLFLASFVLVVNLVVDVSLGYIDPRIRFQ